MRLACFGVCLAGEWPRVGGTMSLDRWQLRHLICLLLGAWVIVALLLLLLLLLLMSVLLLLLLVLVLLLLVLLLLVLLLLVLLLLPLLVPITSWKASPWFGVRSVHGEDWTRRLAQT